MWWWLLACPGKEPSLDSDCAVFPGAVETCDGADEDCDGSVDEGLEAHADADGDGYGDPVAMVPCADGVEDASDCDDGDGAVHPGAVETCNGVDDDCNGDIDVDAVEKPSWFPDGDADGWGTGSAVATQCAPLSGHASASGDCDDADPAISPGAVEVCDNGVDEDCDGGGCRIEGDWDPESHAAFAILGDTDDEGLVDTGPLWIGSDPGLYVASQRRAWLFRTPPAGDAYVWAADATLSFGAAPLQHLETIVLGDVDGDGDSDLAFSVGSSSEGSTVYVLSAEVATGDIADRAWLEIAASYGLGASRHVGDADGDELPDLAFGLEDQRAVVVPLGISGRAESLATTSVTSADATIGFAGDVELGDLDADGVADLVVGAPLAGGDGAAFVFDGPLGVALAETDADAVLADPSAWYSFGTYVQIERDLDDDGTDDLLVASLAGDFWTLFAAGDNSGRAYLGDAGGGHATIDSGDLDGDGHADLVLGKWDGEGPVYYGPVRDGDHSDVSSADGVIFGGDFASPGLLLVGDLNADGCDDLGVISAAENTPVAQYAGTVWGLMGSGGF